MTTLGKHAALGIVLLLAIGAGASHSQIDSTAVTRFDAAEIYALSDQQPPSESIGAEVALPHDWRMQPTSSNAAWYRMKINLKKHDIRPSAVYVPSLDMTPTIYVNDTYVGGERTVTHPLPRYWNIPAYADVPDRILEVGENQLWIRLEAHRDFGRISEVYFGPKEAISNLYRIRAAWRIGLVYATAGVSLILSFFVIAIAFVLRDATYAWFALFAASWAMQNLIAVTVYIPVSTYAWDYLTYLTMGSLITSGSLFSVRMSNNGVIGWTRALILFVASGLIYLTCALLFKQSVLNDVGTFLWLPGLTVFAVLAVFNLLIKAMKQPNIDALLLSLCFFVALVLSVNDWMVVAGVGYRHNAQLLQFGAIPILLVFSITLLRRFLANAQALTLVNQNLELLITEKTAALEAEFKRNANLEYQNLLAEERERIMRDMHDGVGGSLIRLIAMLKQNTVRDRQLKAHLQSALDDLRMMIDSLEEFDHDVGAVLGVFRHRVEPQLQSTGIQLEWYVSDLSPLPSFGPQQVLHLLRILQELVTNTIKHAYASKISISATSIDGDTDEILLRYSDDGIGFPDEYSAGRGLKHMRFRAREAGFELVYPEPSHSSFLLRITSSKGASAAN